MTRRVLVGWGSGADGQLGETNSEVTSRPRLVPGLPDNAEPYACFAGLWSSVIVTDGGHAVYQTVNQTFNGHHAAPRKIDLPDRLTSVASVACGREFTLLLSASGHVWTMGSGANGQLGHGPGIDVLATPTRIESLSDARIVAVAAAEFHWLALDALGFVYACGGNAFGQLGLGNTTNVSVPTVVTALWPHPVVSVATGDCHSAVLTATGSVLCFGSNKNGQLGQQAEFLVKMLALTPVIVPLPKERNRHFEKQKISRIEDDDSVMTDVEDADERESEHLAPDTPLVFTDVACGQAHTVALRSDGSVVCWGKGENGQLGSRATRTMYAPVVVQVPQRYVAVAAGALHSAAITDEGVAYLWGDGRLGQIGDGDMNDKLLPVSLGEPRPFPHAHGSASEMVPVETRFRYLSIDCGGHHNLSIVSNDENAKVVVKEDIWKERIPFCNVEQMMSPKSGLLRFGSAAVLLRTFIKPGLTRDSPERISYVDIDKAYLTFLQTFGSEGEDILGKAAAKLRHEAQVAFGLVRDDDGSRFGNSDFSKRSLVTPRGNLRGNDESFRATVANMEECGLLFALAFLNPIYSAKDRVRETAELGKLLLRVERDGREAFLEAVAHCPNEFIVTRFIRPLQGVLTDELKVQRMITKIAIVASKALALIYHAVLRASERTDDHSLIVPRQEFYNEAVSEDVNLERDYERWNPEPAPTKAPPLPVANAPDVQFSFCRYSFLLSEAAKFRILGLESRTTMNEESMRSVLSFGSITGTPFGRVFHTNLNQEQVYNLQNLLLHVSRDNIVSDTFAHIAQAHPSELHKPLKVKFKGEDGVDEGGVQKEFYQVLLGQLLSPAYGMFSYDEETRYHWFRIDFLEAVQSWAVIGIIFGIAAFNSILLNVQFPLVLYKKLEGVFSRKARYRHMTSEYDGGSDYVPTLGDLKKTFPSIGNSLGRLLEYEEDDVEDVFCLTYQISYQGLFDKAITVDLIPNGVNVAVTNENRQDFVDRYVKYLLHDSIEQPFKQFANGFAFMLGGPFINQFRPEELETLVVGEQELDFEALRRTTKYEGYTEDSTVIRNLWQVLSEFGQEEKALFLSFVTGTDRAPIGGLNKLALVVQKAGQDSNRLPTSHTCFNVLLLPDYGTRAKLRDRLTTAIHNSQGFGLR